MKVDGQLDNAQLENLADANPSPTPVGRVYVDTTTPGDETAKIFLKGAWREIILAQSSSLISQDSGKACTVNWATGLNQKVVLTDNCTISFSNPQEGQAHLLTVVQRATDLLASATAFAYTLNMSDQACGRDAYQPIPTLRSSEARTHVWFYSGTVEAAYATIHAGYAAPTTLPATLATAIDVHPDRDLVAFSRTSSPFMSSARFYDSGSTHFWNVVAPVAATAAAAQVVSCAYHPSGQMIVLASGTSPFVQMYPTDNYGIPSLTVFPDPATLPTGAAKAIGMHPTGSHVCVGHASSPFISVYPITNGFGVKLTDPASLPVAQVNAAQFCPQGDYLAVASQTTPFLEVYPFSTVSGFGAKLTAPSTLPSGGPPAALSGHGLAWNPAGTFLAVASSVTPYLFVYPFSRSSGTFGVPTTPFVTGAPAAVINAVAWSPCGNFLAAGNATSMYLYDMSAGAGLPSAAPVAFDSTGPAAQINGIVWSKDGRNIFLALNATPYVQAFRAPRKAKNYMK